MVKYFCLWKNARHTNALYENCMITFIVKPGKNLNWVGETCFLEMPVYPVEKVETY